MATAAIDIRGKASEICRALGLEPSDVASINLTPTSAIARIYKRNEQGSKHVDPETHKPVCETLSFPIENA